MTYKKMPQEKPEIKKRKIERIIYYTSCPMCGVEITAVSEETCRINLRNHLKTHKDKSNSLRTMGEEI